MTHAHGAMADADVADRLPARANRVDEVAHVIIRHRQARRILTKRFGHYPARSMVAVACFNLAAADEDPFAVLAFEADPVLAPAGANELRPRPALRSIGISVRCGEVRVAV